MMIIELFIYRNKNNKFIINDDLLKIYDVIKNKWEVLYEYKNCFDWNFEI